MRMGFLKVAWPEGAGRLAGERAEGGGALEDQYTRSAQDWERRPNRIKVLKTSFPGSEPVNEIVFCVASDG